MAKRVDIKPQPGFQYNFLSTPADIAIGGSGAGVGKTFALLMEGMRHRNNPEFGGVIFRRSYPQITMEGGLWDESNRMYPHIGGIPTENNLTWTFPKQSTISFRHLGSEKVLSEYQGAQIPLIEFDELTHFTRKMILYMLTRNRSTCGVRPYVRASCNPDPDSYAAHIVHWWIDPETGFPIPERAGVLRYMTNDEDQIVWGNTPDEVIEKAGHLFDREEFEGLNKRDLVKSVTFIPGKIRDNKILLQKDPGYLANLLAQDETEKARLLDGNWKVRVDKTQLFQYMRLQDMFNNVVKVTPRDEYFVTIDHARFGRDLCVIGTWHGWRLIRIDIMPTSSTDDITNVLKIIRRLYKVPASNMIIDQDGIGVKDAMNCHAFAGAAAEYEVRDDTNPIERVGEVFTKRGYKNQRAQMYYYLAEKVNQADMSVDLNNVWYHERGNSQQVTSIKIGGVMREVKELFIEDLSKIRREKIDKEGKKQITPKEAVKNALGGRSPDFGDMAMMRSAFDFMAKKRYLS